MTIGRIKMFNAKRRYGFITDYDGKEYFVRSSSIMIPSGFLAVGSMVVFVPTTNEKGREAINVRPYS